MTKRYPALMGFAAAALLSCDSPTNLRSPVSAVEISPSSNSIGNMVSLHTAEQFQLHAAVTRADGTAAPGEVVTWESTAPQLATVDSTGLVRTAETYAACGVYNTAPFGCGLSVIATADGKADTVSVLVTPKIVFEFAPETTIIAGDSVPLAALSPVAKVDGEVRCTYFLRFVYPGEVLRRSGAFIVAVAPGEGVADWGPNHNLCRAAGTVTPIHVVAR
jgi:hypothetical protein